MIGRALCQARVSLDAAMMEQHPRESIFAYRQDLAQVKIGSRGSTLETRGE